MDVRYENKIRIQDLPLVSQLSDSLLNKSYIDVSIGDSSGKYRLSVFKGKNDQLATAAANRYKTEDNELSKDDIKLFSQYTQGGDLVNGKDLYFEKHPIVDTLTENNMLQDSQLLTKANIEEFESYLSNKKQVQKSFIPLFNWENEWPLLNKDNVDESIQDTVSGTPYWQKSNSYENLNFKDFLTNSKYEAKATYKFLYSTSSPNERNPERVTNIIPLNKFKDNGEEITAVVHLSIAGFVSVKTDLPNQESGTIYLEARRADKNTIGADNPWQTIDSAVFKFYNPKSDKKSPGTFITLNGYLTTEFETRLKLNLKSNAYSMNMFESREETLTPITHFVNTFIGIVHIPNVRSTPTNAIYFTNINYQPYLKDNDGLVVISKVPPQDLASETDVNYIIDLFKNGQSSTVSNNIKYLKVNSSGMEGIKTNEEFEINGLRLSPTGKIYPRGGNIPIHPGMTVYPSYTSGVVYVKKPANVIIQEKQYPSINSYNSGSYVFDNFDKSYLAVLRDVQWPTETIIYSQISIQSLLHYNNYQYWTTGGIDTARVESPPETISIPGTFSISSYATEKPRRQYPKETYTIRFNTELTGKELVGDISCSFTAWSDTWGPGNGNESYGKIYSGNEELIKPHYFQTKNISRGMTYGLCTGSRWSCSRHTITASCKQPNTKKYLRIEAYADTAEDDGSDKTCFGVYLSNLKVTYRYMKDIEINTIVEHETGGDWHYYGKTEAEMNNTIVSSCVIPTIPKQDLELTPCEIPEKIENIFPVPLDATSANEKSIFNDISSVVNYQNANKDHDEAFNKTHTELTVYPFPQNLIF